MCIGLLLLSAQVSLWPSTLSVGAFRGVADYVSAGGIAVYGAIVGVVSVVALYHNGRSLFWGPLTRSVCAIARAALWVQFVYALIVFSFEREAPSAFLSFWSAFTVSEIYTAYRAALDVRRNI